MNQSQPSNRMKWIPWRGWMPLFLLALLTLSAYWNSLNGPFHYDDEHSIVENISLDSLDPRVIFRSNNPFRFLGFYSFALNKHLHGLDFLPGWHAVNIFLHYLCGLLIYGLGLHMFRGPGRQGMATLWAGLFLLHPLCSEPVNYLQARHVQGYTLATLAAAYCTCLFRQGATQGIRYAAAAGGVLSFLGGAFSKEVGLFFVPGAVLLVVGTGVCREEPERKFLTPARIVWVFIFALVLACILHQIRPLPDLFRPTHHPMIGNRNFLTNTLAHAGIYFRYLALVWPDASRQSVDHTVRVAAPEIFQDWVLAFLPLLGILILLAAAFFYRRRHPFILFAALWSLMGILPYMLITVGSAEMMVEYKFYLSIIGVFGVMTYLLRPLAAKVGAKSSRWALLAIIVLVCTAWLIRETRERNRTWSSVERLWTDALRQSPNKARPHYHLGNVFAEQHRYREASQSYRKALAVYPEHFRANNNLANVLRIQGEFAEAAAHYRVALVSEPENLDILSNYAACLGELDRVEEAKEVYRNILEKKPTHLLSRFNLAFLLLNQEQPMEALGHLEMAYRQAPAEPRIPYHMGRAYGLIGDMDQSSQYFRRTLALDPKFVDAPRRLVDAYLQAGRHEEAIGFLAEEAERYPEVAVPWIIAGRIHLTLKQHADAKRCFLKGLKVARAAGQGDVVSHLEKQLLALEPFD